jgi:hypothetical protein
MKVEIVSRCALACMTDPTSVSNPVDHDLYLSHGFSPLSGFLATLPVDRHPQLRIQEEWYILKVPYGAV